MALPSTALALVALLGAALVPLGEACTAIGVGRSATTDGSVMVAHTTDSGGMGDARLARVPARDHEPGSMRNVYLAIADYPRMLAPERSESYVPLDDVQAGLPWAKPIGAIPEVNHTYAYWDVDYGLGNEFGLVLAESTCGGRWGASALTTPNGTALFGIEELSKVALERCKTARCAVQTMGALGEEYGYYGGNSHLGEFGAGKVWPGATSGEEGEALIVGDAAGELWVFHILPGPEGGAVWAAQRMPDDSITIVANMFMIREMDLADPDHFLASAGIEALAKKHGLNRAAFDFTEAFSGDFKAGTRTDQLVGSFYTGRRVWRVFDLAAPSLKLDPELGSVQGFATYPPFVRPEFKLSAGWLRNMLRDHFEGTPYDLTQGPGAGPYGTPNRWDGADGEYALRVGGAWERGISIHRTIFAFVAVARPTEPQALSGLVWFGNDSPHATCFAPLFLNQDAFPESFTTGNMAVYSERNAWWAAQSVKKVMDINYGGSLPYVQAAQAECEGKGEAAVAQGDKAVKAMLLQTHKASAKAPKSHHAPPPEPAAAPALVRAALTDATSGHADYVVAKWRGLLGDLFVRFKNGYNVTVVLEGNVAREGFVGYPLWWLKAAGYAEWGPRADAAQALAMKRFKEAAKAKAKEVIGALYELPRLGAPLFAAAHASTAAAAAPSTSAFALCAAFSFAAGAATLAIGQRLGGRGRRAAGAWAGAETGLLAAERAQPLVDSRR